MAVRRLCSALVLALVVALLPSASASGATDRPWAIVLTPTADPSTSQLVTWRTATAWSHQRVEVRGPDARVRGFTAVRKARTTVRSSGSAKPAYRARLSGLVPGTRYSYRIVTPAGASRWYRFTTAASGAVPFTFLTLGDTQIKNAGVPENIIDAAVKRYPDARLVLHAGDVVNSPWRRSEWNDLLKAMAPTRVNRNWIVSRGNHEHCALVSNCRSGRGQGFRTYFSWPDNGYPKQRSSWFYVDYQGVRFVVLDTFGSDLKRQAAFLDQALAKNPNRWSVVLMHSGPFAAGKKRTNSTMRSVFLPVITKRKVDLVLSGHDHSYARGYLGDPDSTVFLTSVSGPKFYDSSAADWRRGGATRVAAASRTATYQAVTVSGDTMTVRTVVGYRGSGARPAAKVGSVLDHVTITKSSSGVKTVR